MVSFQSIAFVWKTNIKERDNTFNRVINVDAPLEYLPHGHDDDIAAHQAW